MTATGAAGGATAGAGTVSPRQASLAINGGTPVSAEPIPMIAVRLGDAEIDAAVQVMRSGRLVQGSVVRQFEERFAEMTGARHAIATSNGTTALQLVYHVLLPRDAAAIVPAWTFIATASMVRARPAVPRFADVHADRFTIDVRSAEQHLTADTHLIVPVHLYGNPVEIDEVEAFAARHRLHVVYDAAQSHLATWRGKGLGAFGDAVTYSFYPTKNMTTGEGGMVTTNDDALAAELRVVRDHGMRTRYLHEALGFNYRLTDVFAAVGLEQLKRLEEWTAARRANAARLDSMLAGVAGITTPTVAAHGEHVYHLYTIRLDRSRFSCTRDEFAAALAAEGCGYAVHYPRPLTRQPVFLNDLGIICPPLPVAEQLAEEVLSLPVHPMLTDTQVSQVAEAVRKVADAYRIN